MNDPLESQKFTDRVALLLTAILIIIVLMQFVR